MEFIKPDIKTIGREVLFLHAVDGIPRRGEGSCIKLKNGAIMYVYNTFEGADWKDECPANLAVVYSYDEGETWSEPRTLFARDAEAMNLMCPSPIRLKNGNLGIVYLRKSGLACTPYFVFSEDEGETFSEPIRCIEDDGMYVVENDHVIVLESGRILVPMNKHKTYENAEKYYSPFGRMQMLASDDNGKTWNKISDLIESPFSKKSSRNGLQETCVFQRQDGTIRAFSRTDIGCQLESFSEDEGTTWTVPQANRFFSSPLSPMLMKNVGKYTIAVFNPIPRFTTRNEGITWGRTPLVCAVSEDDGETFGRVYYLETDPENGYCYPSIFDGGDYMLISYYHSDNLDSPLRSVKMVKIMLDEISE